MQFSITNVQFYFTNSSHDLAKYVFHLLCDQIMSNGSKAVEPNFSVIEARVLYADTDQMGVVYHGTYFRWFEAGRGDYMRRRGESYASCEKSGIQLPVIEVNATYRKPAKYDDLITIKTSVENIGPVVVHFCYEISKDDNLLVKGFTKHAAINESGRPVRFPVNIGTALLGKELG